MRVRSRLGCLWYSLGSKTPPSPICRPDDSVPSSPPFIVPSRSLNISKTVVVLPVVLDRDLLWVLVNIAVGGRCVGV